MTLALFADHGETGRPASLADLSTADRVYGAFLVALVGGPVLLAAVFVSDDPIARSRVLTWLGEPTWMRVTFLMLFLLGTWWMVLGLLLSRLVGGVHAIFWPFADWFERRHALRMARLGLFFLAVSGAIFALLKWG